MTSPRHRTIVRREHPQQWLFRLAGVAVMLFLVAGGAYWLGASGRSASSVPLFNESDALRDSVQRLETELSVETATVASLRGSLADSRSAIDELEQELVFYRDVMAPEEAQSGVIIRSPVLRATDREGEWQYQIVMQQGGARQGTHKGDLNVQFYGVEDSALKIYGLEEIDQSLSSGRLAVNFRYFQRFTGTLSFPDGFRPDRVLLRASISQPVKDTVERSLEWGQLVE